MPGVVSLVHGRAGDYVRTAWDTLARECGLREPPGAMAHILHHAAHGHPSWLIDEQLGACDMVQGAPFPAAKVQKS